MAQRPIRVESMPETEKNKLVDVMPEKSSSLDSMTTNEMSVSPPEDDNDFHMSETVQLQVDGPVQLEVKDEVESVPTKVVLKSLLL